MLDDTDSKSAPKRKNPSHERRSKSFDLPRLEIVQLPKIENPPESVRNAFRTKESPNFILTGKKVINNSTLLLMLLLIKMGPLFINRDDNFKSYELALEQRLGVERTFFKFYLTFPYIVSSGIMYFICGIIGVLNSLKFFSLKTVSLYIVFILMSPILLLSHLCFILALANKNIVIVVLSRLIFGLTDAIHYCIFFYFIVKIFKKENLSLSIGFMLALDSLISTITSFMNDIQDLDYFLWTVFFILLFSFGASLSLPYIDLSNESIFTAQTEQLPNTPQEPEKKSRKEIISLTLFVLFHISMVISFYLGLLMFPFGYGGFIWNRLYVPPTDKKALSELIETIDYTRSVVGPGIGALFDTEHKNIIDKNSGTFRMLTSILKRCKVHITSFLIGLFGTVVCNLLIESGAIGIRNSSYYILSVVMGISLSLLINALYSIPWLLINNFVNFRKGYCYVAYVMFIKFIWTFSEMCNTYFIRTEAILFPFWYIILVYSCLVMFSILIIIVYTLVNKEKKDPASISLLFPNEQPKINEEKEESQHISWKSNLKYLWILFYFPLDLLIFLSSLVMFIFASGIINILLYSFYGKKVYFGSVKIFFLPVVSFLCMVSLFMAFPDVTNEFLGSIFFRRTRALLGLTINQTIGDKISRKSDFSMTTFILERNNDIWKYLTSKKVEEKIRIIIYPDECIFMNEEDRYEILLPDKIVVKENYHIEECFNGFIYIPKDPLSKSIFNYSEFYGKDFVKHKFKGFVDLKIFTDHFYLGFYSCYCLFFLIPVIYRVLLKLFCDTCTMVAIFDDHIAVLVTVINFIVGFFIMIPFIELWKEISRIIEQMSDMSLVFKVNSIGYFKPGTKRDFKKYSHDLIVKWNTIFTHLNQFMLSRCTFIKNILIFSFSSSKIISVVFSLLALFVKLQLSQEILQLIFIVIIFEIAVIRYIIMPASTSTNDLRITVKELTLYSAWFGDYVNTYKHLTEKSQKDSMILYKHYRDIVAAWVTQAQMGYIGFQFRVDFIGTGWGIGSDVMRASVATIFLTTIPSIITYFIKVFSV